MKLFKITAILSAVFLSLSGCGGSENIVTKATGPDDQFGQSYQPPGLLGDGTWSLDDLSNFSGSSLWISNGLLDGTIAPGRPSSTATFNGGIALNDDAATFAPIYGRLRMLADFTGNTISGQASDFSKLQTGATTVPFKPLTGTLSLGNGTLTGNVVTGKLAGQLSGDGSPYTISADLNGLFFVELSTDKGIIQGAVTGLIAQGSTFNSLDNGSLFQVAQ